MRPRFVVTIGYTARYDRQKWSYNRVQTALLTLFPTTKTIFCDGDPLEGEGDVE
jgi:hypothetical protein